MRKRLGALAVALCLVGCEMDVSGDGGIFPPTDGGNTGVNVEELLISDNTDMKANNTIYDSQDGAKENITKRFTINSESELYLHGNGSSYFEMGCETAPTYTTELVRFDVNGNELTREALNYQDFEVSAGEQVEIHVGITGIQPSCFSITHSFYVSYQTEEENEAN